MAGEEEIDTVAGAGFPYESGDGVADVLAGSFFVYKGFDIVRGNISAGGALEKMAEGFGVFVGVLEGADIFIFADADDDGVGLTGLGGGVRRDRGAAGVGLGGSAQSEYEKQRYGENIFQGFEKKS
jgi:hypothetical protein